MADDALPPLRVRDTTGTPNLIPVFDIIVTNATITQVGPGIVRLNATGGGGAPTGALYVTMSADGTLTAERVLTAGSSITLLTDATTVTISASTAGFVPTSTTLTTPFPVAGGGDLSASRTISVSTAGFLVTSDRSIATGVGLSGGGNLAADRTLVANTALLVTTNVSVSTLYPVAGGGDLSASRTHSVDTAFLVTSARTISAGAGLSGGGNLGADRTLSLVTPVAVTSGGTGISTLTDNSILVGRGTASVGSMAQLTFGQLVVGSAVGVLPQVLNSGAAGQVLISSGGTALGLVWVNTLAAGGGASAPSVRQLFGWTIPYFVTPGTAAGGVLVGTSLTITEVLLYADTAPTTAAIFVDVNVNGNSIFQNNTSNMPRIVGAANLGSSVTLNTATLLRADRLTFDIDSGSGGNFFYVAIIGS